MNERWLSWGQAGDTIQHRMKTSVGRSEAKLREAILSGEIRIQQTDYVPELGCCIRVRWQDISVVSIDAGEVTVDINSRGMRRRDRIICGGLEISEADLLDWLNRMASAEVVSLHQYRHAGDAELIEEGRRLVATGMSKLKAAEKLALKAEGGTLEQRTERLRKLI